MAHSPALSETQQRWLVTPRPVPPPAPAETQAELRPELRPQAWTLLTSSDSASAPPVPWRILGLAILLGYITTYQSLRMLVHSLVKGVNLGLGSLLSGAGILLLGYLCWRLVKDLRQWWRDRRDPPSHSQPWEIYCSRPVLRIGEPVELRFIQRLAPGDGSAHSGQLDARIYCQRSLPLPPASAPSEPQGQTLLWQSPLGQSPLVCNGDLIAARFCCTLPAGLPASLAVCGLSVGGDRATSFEVSWWLHWELTLPDLAPRGQRLELAVQPEVVQ